jgi:hypothetical protein
LQYNTTDISHIFLDVDDTHKVCPYKPFCNSVMTL